GSRSAARQATAGPNIKMERLHDFSTKAPQRLNGDARKLRADGELASSPVGAFIEGDMRISKLSTAPVRRRASALALLSALTLAPGAALANELLNVYRDAASNDTVLQAAGFARDAGLQARPQARASLLPQ